MTVQQHVEEAHARLGCSNPRWRYCPGSVREEAKYPNISSAAATDGTGSHLLLELCLKNGVRAESYVGEVIGVGDADSPGSMGWFVEIDRAKRVQICLDYVERRVHELKQKYPDCRVSVIPEGKAFPGYTYNRSDWWGTCDISIMAMTNNNDFLHEIEVVDYKDGRRYVSEVANTQMLDYMLGKYSVYMAGKSQSADPVLVTTIVQPKTDKPVRPYGTTVFEVTNHGESMYKAALATDDPEAPLVSGKHCFYCLHKQNCNAQTESKIERGSIMDNNIVEKVETSLTTMPSDELATILNAEEVMLAAFAKAKDEALRRLKEGQPINGWVLGNGNAKHVWNEPEEVIAKKLKGMGLKKDEINPPGFITPAKARKLEWTDIKRKNLENLISTVAGNTRLVKGKTVTKSVDDFFMGVSDSGSTTPELPQPTQPTIPDFM